MPGGDRGFTMITAFLRSPQNRDRSTQTLRPAFVNRGRLTERRFPRISSDWAARSVRVPRLLVCVVWLSHMKTTIDIADPLLRQAKRLAARRNTTLKALVEGALRDELARDRTLAGQVSVHTHTFGGHGLQAGLSWDEWSGLRSLAYEGRGG